MGGRGRGGVSFETGEGMIKSGTRKEEKEGVTKETMGSRWGLGRRSHGKNDGKGIRWGGGGVGEKRKLRGGTEQKKEGREKLYLIMSPS